MSYTDEHRSVNLSPGQQWATVILQCIYTSVLIASRRSWFGPSWSKSPHVSNIQRLQTWYKLYVGNHPCSKENSGVWHHSWRDSLKSTLMSSQCVLGGHLLGCSVLGHIYLGSTLQLGWGLLMRKLVTEHTVLVATHTIWEHVAMYLWDPITLSQCSCL